jgi:hypothetical protein
VYNIQKAVSRLDYAPKLKEIQVTDFEKGLGEFTPKPDRPVSFVALKETLKKAGYTLDSAEITIAGTLAKDAGGWTIIVRSSGQRFVLAGPNVDQALTGKNTGDSVEITGDWKTVGAKTTAQETITLTIKSGARIRSNFSDSIAIFTKIGYRPPSDAEPPTLLPPVSSAPIRVTSPGLTVYKGGAISPRVYFVKQHLGTLDVDRQIVDLSASYTPSPRLQLEIEAPLVRTSFDDGTTAGSEAGLGNVTAWTKYRFFRKVKTYGDRQAAMRVGLELPTGKELAPSQAQINVPSFVRAQLTPINGGWSPHFDVAFSQAGGRIIFGGNAEVTLRTEREGFRMGHEQRINTDLEYVIPRDSHKPGGELFLILETSFVHRGTGRMNGLEVSGSRATEYFLAPGLQYAAHPRFVVEGSYQFPVVRNTGPMMLRTDRNVLLGVKYLF